MQRSDLPQQAAAAVGAMARYGAEAASWRRRHIPFTGFRFATQKQLDLWREAGIRDFIVGLTNEDDDNRGIDPSDRNDVFKWRHGAAGPRKLAQNMEWAAQRGMFCWPMTWLRATPGWCTTAAAALLPHTEHPGCGPLMLNTERYFHRVLPVGMSHQEAVEAHFVPAFVEKGVDLYVTDYASCPAPVLSLLPYMTGGLAQAYSRASWVARHNQKRAGSGDVYLPGRTQDYAEVRWGRCMSPDQDLIIGTAAYDQRGHRGGARAAMTAQCDAVDAAGAKSVAWWSWAAAKPMERQIILDLAARDMKEGAHAR